MIKLVECEQSEVLEDYDSSWQKEVGVSLRHKINGRLSNLKSIASRLSFDQCVFNQVSELGTSEEQNNESSEEEPARKAAADCSKANNEEAGRGLGGENIITIEDEENFNFEFAEEEKNDDRSRQDQFKKDKIKMNSFRRSQMRQIIDKIGTQFFTRGQEGHQFQGVEPLK